MIFQSAVTMGAAQFSCGGNDHPIRWVLVKIARQHDALDRYHIVDRLECHRLDLADKHQPSGHVR